MSTLRHSADLFDSWKQMPRERIKGAERDTGDRQRTAGGKARVRNRQGRNREWHEWAQRMFRRCSGCLLCVECKVVSAMTGWTRAGGDKRGAIQSTHSRPTVSVPKKRPRVQYRSFDADHKRVAWIWLRALHSNFAFPCTKYGVRSTWAQYQLVT